MAEDKREPTRALDKASRVMDALAAENGPVAGRYRRRL